MFAVILGALSALLLSLWVLTPRAPDLSPSLPVKKSNRVMLSEQERLSILRQLEQSSHVAPLSTTERLKILNQLEKKAATTPKLSDAERLKILNELEQ